MTSTQHQPPQLSTFEEIVEYDFLINLYEDYRIYTEYYLSKPYRKKNEGAVVQQVTEKLMGQLEKKILSNMSHFFSTASISQSLFAPLSVSISSDEKKNAIYQQVNKLGLSIDSNSKEFNSLYNIFIKEIGSGETKNLKALEMIISSLFTKNDFREIAENEAPTSFSRELVKLDLKIVQIIIDFLDANKTQIEKITPKKIEEFLSIVPTWFTRFLLPIQPAIVFTLSVCAAQAVESDLTHQLCLAHQKLNCWIDSFYKCTADFEQLERDYKTLTLEPQSISHFLTQNVDKIKKVIFYLSQPRGNFINIRQVDNLMFRLNEELEKIIYSSNEALDLVHSHDIYAPTTQSALQMFMVFYTNKNGWDKMLLNISTRWLDSLTAGPTADRQKLALCLAADFISRSCNRNYLLTEKEILIKEINSQSAIELTHFILALESDNSIRAFKLILPYFIACISPYSPMPLQGPKDENLPQLQLYVLKALLDNIRHKEQMQTALSLIEKSIFDLELKSYAAVKVEKFKL